MVTDQEVRADNWIAKASKVALATLLRPNGLPGAVLREAVARDVIEIQRSRRCSS